MIGLDVSPMNDVPPHNPEYCPSMLKPEQLHVIFHTISTSLPAPVRTSHPCLHHITIQVDIQSFTPQCSKYPNPIILPRLTTSASLSTPIESTLRLLSSNDTPQIHLTIYSFARHMLNVINVRDTTNCLSKIEFLPTSFIHANTTRIGSRGLDLCLTCMPLFYFLTFLAAIP